MAQLTIVRDNAHLIRTTLLRVPMNYARCHGVFSPNFLTMMMITPVMEVLSTTLPIEGAD